MHSSSCQHGHKSSGIPYHTLMHPQYYPHRGDIAHIKKQAADRPLRVRQIKIRYCSQYIAAICLLWLISDSNVRFYYATGDLNMLLLFHGYQLLSCIIYYALSVSDPGYIDINDADKQQQHQNEEEASDDMVFVQRTVDLNSPTLPPTFCERCKLFKPERCKHCYACDRCVLLYDHHCTFLDICVGLQNYRLFFAYVCVQGSISFWTFWVAVHCLFRVGEISNWIQFGLRIILFVWMLYQCLGALALIVTHSHLISTGQTTHEFVVTSRKRDILVSMNESDRRCCCVRLTEKIYRFLCCKLGTYPYSKGVIKNWINFFLNRGHEQKWIQARYPVTIGEYE